MFVLAKARFILIVVLALLGAHVMQAQYVFDFNAACEKAYESIVELRLSEGREQLNQLRRSQPNNLIPVWLEDYADFFEVYISEDKEVFDRLEHKYHQRLDLLERGPKNSPYYRYTQANVMLHWALARLKFGEYVTTFREARKAYKLLEENLATFPDFALTRKELGVLQAAVATVPSGYQWGVEFVTGMDGDLEGGKLLIESLLKEQRKNNSPFLRETTAIYAFLLLNLEREEEEAWSRIKGASFDESRNLLGVFVLANIAMRTGRNEEAIRLLSNRPHSPHYYPFPYLDFMLGVCLQRKLDDDAGVYLRSFIERKKRGNFIKEAYQKLAWEKAIAGDRYGYFQQLKNIIAYGTEVVGSDKNSLREAELKVFPNPELLRARLLYDGGYFDRAAASIEAVNPKTLSGEQLIEFPYRAARIAEARHRVEDAKRLYKQTISIGRNSPAYFACKAAVELGVIAERAKEKEQAEVYFKLALKLDPSEYGPDLHQQAKAGLARMKG